MRFLAALGLILAVLLAGCGTRGDVSTKAASRPRATTTPPAASADAAHASAARVARAWSRALNHGDNDRAADLFAPGARVEQGGVVLVLRTHADARSWNEALPCSGRIVRIEVRADTATAEFVLGDRSTSPCDGPGRHATAEFRVRRGKIVLWKQLPDAVQPPALAI